MAGVTFRRPVLNRQQKAIARDKSNKLGQQGVIIITHLKKKLKKLKFF